mgnify:CR=1 FL=1
MDKNTLTGLILIGAVVIAFMFLNKPNENIQNASANNTTKSEDSEYSNQLNKQNKNDFISSNSNEKQDNLNSDSSILQSTEQDLESLKENFGLFYNCATGKENTYILKNDKIKLSISSKGAKIKREQQVYLSPKKNQI